MKTKHILKAIKELKKGVQIGGEKFVSNESLATINLLYKEIEIRATKMKEDINDKDLSEKDWADINKHDKEENLKQELALKKLLNK